MGEQAISDHRAGATRVLLSWLEDEVDGTIKRTSPRQLAGRTEQHCHVTVMAAGVDGTSRNAGHRYSIHLGAKADSPAFRVRTVIQTAYDSGAADAPVDPHTKRFQRFSDEGRRRCFGESGFGVAREPSAPFPNALAIATA
jgi:hypothetical protein